MPHAASDYVFFWKPTQEHGWAGQWFPSPLIEKNEATGEDVRFPTAEHYMMYHKAILFDDSMVANDILKAKHPAEVKKLGRAVRDFTDEKWNEKRYEIVVNGNMLKFTQNEELKTQLLATGDKILVEASPLDKIWGIGRGAAKAMQYRDSWGQNLLGKALMDVRTKLREQQAEEAADPTEEGGGDENEISGVVAEPDSGAVPDNV